MTLSEQLQALPVWKQIFDSFFVDVLGKRIEAARESTGSVVHFADNLIEEEQDTAFSGETSSKKRKRQQVVKSFPTPVFHEKTTVVLSSLFALIEKGGSAAGGEAMISSYLKKTLGVLRTSCSSLEEFESLWNSPVFSGCRQLYEPMLVKCSAVQKELFGVLSSDVKAEVVSVQKRKTDPVIIDAKTQGDTSDLKLDDTTAHEKATDVGFKPEGADKTGNGFVDDAEPAVDVEANGAVDAGAAVATTDSKAADTSSDVRTENFKTLLKADSEDSKTGMADNNSVVKGDASAVNNVEEEIIGVAVKAETAETDAESVATAVETSGEGDDTDVKMEDAEEEAKSSTAKYSTGDADSDAPDGSPSDALPASIAMTETSNEFTQQQGESTINNKTEGTVDSSDTQKEVAAEALPEPPVEGQKDGKEKTQAVVEEGKEAAETQ
ncbi:hypothetical protein PI126_g8475 [Phytophthora idaei]|nr:hypothetical protein PI126_g8475 [Phytophthora idaei]